MQDGARDGGDRHGIVTAHGLLIYCSSSLRWCIGNDTITNYFILVHSECGDLYKLPRSPLRASSSPSCAATALPLPRQLPTPREALRSFKSGFLFCAGRVTTASPTTASPTTASPNSRASARIDDDSPACFSKQFEADECAVVSRSRTHRARPFIRARPARRTPLPAHPCAKHLTATARGASRRTWSASGCHRPLLQTEGVLELLHRAT